MRKLLPRAHGRLALQLCAAVAVSALMAGCSTDSTRLSDPFSSPFSTSASEQPARHVADAMPAGRTPPVSSRSLSAPSRVAAAAPLRPNLTRSASAAPISHETTGSIEPVRAARGSSFGGWTSSGGVPITVGAGESAEVIAKRYGVPETALLQTNGLSSPSDVRSGSSLTIPVYNAMASSQPTAAPARMASAAPSAKAALTRPTVERAAAAAERRQAARPAPTERLARAEAPHPLKLPAASKPAAVAAEKASIRKGVKAPAVAAAAPVAAEPAPVRTALAKPPVAKPPVAKPAAPVVAQATAPAKPETAAATLASQTTVADASGNPEFRWPARGRIIQGFKGGNDGINIALPDGTPVKAAEGGTVAYAGSELKGYGNLVLIRHPNGFVSAYANNGELDVKRGDSVKRGQVIAKSGQSGNVASPQLHFELRKGATPVDPTTYLAGL